MANNPPRFGVPQAEMQRRYEEAAARNVDPNQARTKQDQPSFWERALMGNFAYDQYPENPSGFPAVSSPEAPYNPFPNPGNYQKAMSPTQYLEFMSSIQLPEGFKNKRGSTAVPYAPPAQAKQPNAPVQVDPRFPKRAPTADELNTFSAYNNSVAGFDEGTPGPGYNPRTVAPSPPARSPNLWERFRNAKNPARYIGPDGDGSDFQRNR